MQLAEFELLGEISAGEYARLNEAIVPVKTMVELAATIQEFNGDYDLFADVMVGTLGPQLDDPRASAAVRRVAEDHLVRIVIFSHALCTLVKRLDPEEGSRFADQVVRAGREERPLALARAMRNYREHLYRLPVRYRKHPEQGLSAWWLILDHCELLGAADRGEFRLDAAMRHELESPQSDGGIDVAEVCTLASRRMLDFADHAPIKSALETQVLPACDVVEAFLVEHVPDGRPLYVSGPDSDEPKRGIAIARRDIAIIRQLYRNSQDT